MLPEATAEDLSLLKNYTGPTTDPGDVPEILNTLERVPRLALDLETTSLNWVTGDIHGFALGTADREWYVCHQALDPIIDGLKSVLKDPHKLVYGHNLKFDLHFLGKHGIRPPRILDTMVGQNLVDENQSLALKILANTKLGIDQKLPGFRDLQRATQKALKLNKIDDVNIHDIPLPQLGVYAARDGRLSYDLGELTQYEMEQEEMDSIYWDIEMPFLYVLMDMEETGFYIDPEALERVGAEFKQKEQEALDRWNALTGGLNPNSHKQVATFLYETKGYPATLTTKSGAPATDMLALTRLKKHDQDGALDALLDYRQYSKLLGTYIEGFRSMSIDNILRGSFNQTGTVTWRLSSSEPNLQNIPGRGEAGELVRALFGVPPGYAMVVIDYSQIELRLLAHYSKDPRLLEVFAEGKDPHQMTADLITNLGYQISRKQAKAVNFGWAYGMGPRGLADKLEKDTGERPKESDCKVWLKGFSEAYPDAEKWKWSTINHARSLGYVRSLDGHRRRLPDLNHWDKSLRAAAERQGPNAVIQGSASSIIKNSMLRISSFMPFFGARLMAQVHDELVFMCPEEVSDEFARAAQLEMEGVEQRFNIRVKILAEPGIGKNWAEAKH